MIVFDEMIADILSNKKLNPTVTELLIRGANLNITFLVYYTMLFCCTKVIQTKFYNYFIMKIPSKGELKQTAFNHSSDIDFKDLMNLYRKKNSESLFFFSDSYYSSIR